MKLENKKKLAARALGINKSRILFNTERLAEIKEAITKQDIKDLVKDKAISIKSIKGRKKITRRKTRRRAGSIKKAHKKTKQDYIKITRKLRKYLSNLRTRDMVSKEDFTSLRKQIKTSAFKSFAHLKEAMSGVEK